MSLGFVHKVPPAGVLLFLFISVSVSELLKRTGTRLNIPHYNNLCAE